MRGIRMHQVETRFGLGEFHLHANAREQEAWNVTEVDMQATIKLDFLALFTEVPTTHESRVFSRDSSWAAGLHVPRVGVPESVGEVRMGCVTSIRQQCLASSDNCNAAKIV
jgi:hypothetical protein